MDFESYPQNWELSSVCAQHRGIRWASPIIDAVFGEDDGQQPPGIGPGTSPATSGRLRPDWLTAPRPDRFHPATPGYGPAMEAHAAAVEAGLDGYIDPESGLFAMTAQYLAKRGWCCGRGCRHCPFEGEGSG